MKNRTNNVFAGFAIGLLSPPIAFSIFVTIVFPGEQLMDIIERYIIRNVLTHVISLSVIINLPLFFLCLSGHRENMARGILGATILYGLLIILMKFT